MRTIIRVAVIEDHAMVSEALVRLLDSTGRFRVVGTAATVKGALALIAAQRPDVVLADLSLEDGNAIGLLRALRRRREAVRTLVLTAFREEVWVAGALAAGASGYVLKYEATAKLLDALEKVAEGATYLSETLAAGRLPPTPSSTGGRALGRLTAREREIFDLIVGGGKDRTIARHLGLSIKTVDTHRTNIARKLGTRTIEALLRFAAAEGIDITRTLPAFQQDHATSAPRGPGVRGKRRGAD